MRSTHHFFITRLFAGAMLAIFVFFGAVQVFVVADNVMAAAPTTNILGYQGRLLDSNGVPVADATASVIFELYTSLSGGTCVWSNSSTTCGTATARTVALTDGLFSEPLGDTAASPAYAEIGDAIFANNPALYLQVTVNTEPLVPRKRILAAGYALNSQTLDGYNTTLTGGTTSAVTVLDANGNLQLTGNPQGSSASQGALYINPAGAVVAANDMLLGLAVDGVSRFTVDGEGDVTAEGDVAVKGGDITSTVALSISSSGGDISLAPSGSGLAYVTAGDDFAVGGNSLVAPFSFDESANTLRIGDGANDTADPSIVFYASNGSSLGTLSYSDLDELVLSGGNFSHDSLGVLPVTSNTRQREHAVKTDWTGTSGATLGILQLHTLSGVVDYAATEAVGTTHKVVATEGSLTISGTTTTLTDGYAVSGRLTNNSTSASLLGAGYLAAVDGMFEHSATATTLTSGHGVRGSIYSGLGTVTDAYGVYGTVLSGAGDITRGYGGYFLNNAEGTTRYGVYGYAEGGTANYAGYFTGAAVHVDDNATPNTADSATAAGDLYVADGFEVDGSVSLGDVAGTDTFSFATNIATTSAATFTMNGLTSGSGVEISRPNGAADFTGSLLVVSQEETSIGSTGDALTVKNDGGGDSVGLYITQTQITDETNGAGGTTVGAQALVLETDEAGSNDDIMLVRANGQLTLAIESDGSVLSDNSFSSAGADYAEYFATADASLVDSEVVCHDRASANMVKRCEAGNTEVVGVISPTPGFIGGLPDYDDTSLHAIVGLTGQIDTFVTADSGAIAIGDPVTASQTRAGYAALAQGPVRIIGFALEPLASGTGTIKIYVNPQWYGGDVLATDGSATVSSANIVLAPLAPATVDDTAISSHDLVLRGSSWNGTSAMPQSMSLRLEAGSADYRLSVVNTVGSQVAYVSDSGDLALAGRLYPSDRGVLQTNKYIYYDGSTGIGGDMMRTNAAGWSSGSYDFAEMFPSKDMLAAGEVVVFSDDDEHIRRSTGIAYDDRIAGVVSTRPAFLAGENRIGDVPVALAGRVPTYVSGENGTIAIGDPLTTSAKAGYAMKATEPGPIVGYAMEGFSGTTGVIVTFIRPSYYDGGAVEEAPLAENSASDIRNLATLDISGSLNMNGGSILSVSSLIGIGEQWRIEEDGDFFTRGRIVQIVKSYAGQDVETYASASREQTIELSGTAMLNNGRAVIAFERIDPSFNDIIANEIAYRVYLTPAGMTGMLAAVDRTNEGFTIQEAGSSRGVAVDWLVVAYHKDFAPEAILEEVPVVSEITEPVVEVPVVEAPIVEELIVAEPVAEDPVVEEPLVEIVIEEEVATPIAEVPIVEEPLEVIVSEELQEQP